MPTSIIKTKEDERLWEKAKSRAEEEGKAENWAYVMGIYKRMNPDRFDKAAGRWETYTVSVSSVGDTSTDRDNDRDMRNKLDSYRLVNREVTEEGVDYIVEVPSASYPVFLGDMADTAHMFRPAEVKLYKGVHGREIRLGSMALRVASAWLTAYDEKGRTPDGWQHGTVEEFEQNEGEGSQTPPAHDHGGKPIEVPSLGMMDIPGMEWEDKSPSFHTASMSDLLEAARDIQRANEMLHDVADILDARIEGPSLSDLYREAAEVSRELRTQISLSLTKQGRKLQEASRSTKSASGAVDIQREMRALQRTVQDVVQTETTRIEHLMQSVFQKNEITLLDFKLTKDRGGWVQIEGRILDRAPIPRSERDLANLFGPMFDSYPNLTGKMPEWAFILSGYPPYC